MSKRTVEVSFETVLTFRPEKRSEFTVDLYQVPESVIAKILEVGARTILTNTYNGGGKDATEAEREAKVDAKVKAWLSGDFNANGGERGDSLATEMKDAFIAKQIVNGRTVKQAEATIRDTVTAAFGKDEKASFGRFLEAVATLKAKATGSSYEGLLTELQDAAMLSVEAARKARAEAEAESPVNVDAADLF